MCAEDIRKAKNKKNEQNQAYFSDEIIISNLNECPLIKEEPMLDRSTSANNGATIYEDAIYLGFMLIISKYLRKTTTFLMSLIIQKYIHGW
jgi:hypothetical protein